MKTKKKIPVKKKTKRNEVVEHQVELFKMASDARYRLAMQAYEAQDAETRLALDTMRDRLRQFGTGYIRVFPDGKQGGSIAIPIEPVYQDQNILYLATEIFKDLALMDIRVESYEFPKVFCAECGEKISVPKKKKAKV